ncbi:MAG: hypothetical protein AVDCRST_MAG76-766 [uncultured Acidimicrobiales bacterium]|uniref:Uncharacterized protein n=1 Tax=uncultured Acidimicrobiales bacterium TaxID=310071 RepID=A0A6J4HHE1_9ACTN|nr:MAG: hypothetical protein AVDCRST_MAG76-766 [uncultured Acidimicrobiales bacterium]
MAEHHDGILHRCLVEDGQEGSVPALGIEQPGLVHLAQVGGFVRLEVQVHLAQHSRTVGRPPRVRESDRQPERRRGDLVEALKRFASFCTSDVARYQLLFQRTIPGFEPSPSTYAQSLRAFEVLEGQLAAVGVMDPRAVGLWTARRRALW